MHEIHFSKLFVINDCLYKIPQTSPMYMRFFRASLNLERKIRDGVYPCNVRIRMYSEQECYDMIGYLNWPYEQSEAADKFRTCRERFIASNGGRSVIPWLGQNPA